MSKKDIVKYIIDEYGVTSPTDITNALKDLLGETLQDMLNSEFDAVSYTHLRAHETLRYLVCRLLLEKKNI